MMTNAQVRSALLRAAALIRRGWCTGAPAKNAYGQPVGPRDDDAVAWCAIGAIHKACGSYDEGYEARFALRQVIGRETIQDWNDVWAKDSEQVARTFEEAARLAR